MQARAQSTSSERVELAFKRHILEKTCGFASEPMEDLYRVQTLGMMLNRYDALCESGLSEENGVQRVCYEFSDLAVRMRDMGFEALEAGEPASRWPQLTQEEAERYLRECDAYQHRIALGVALCTACVSPVLLTLALAELFFGFAGDAASLLGVGGLFGMIAMGVYLIVTAARPRDNKRIKKGRFSLGSRLKSKLSQMRELVDQRARSRRGKGIAMIVLCLMPVLLGIAVDEILLWRMASESGTMLGVMGMFLQIAAGVYELVMADGEKKTMKRLLDQGE